MTQLYKVVSDLYRLVICSNDCGGLLNTVHDVLP
jgi:hypothetical protein